MSARNVSQVIHPSAAAGALTIGANMTLGPVDGLLGPVGQVVTATSFVAVGAYLLALLALSILVVVRRLGRPLAAIRPRSTSCVPALEGHT